MRRLPTVDYRPNDDRLFVKVYVRSQRGKVFWTNALVDTGATGMAVSGRLARTVCLPYVQSVPQTVWGHGERFLVREAGIGIKCGPTYCRAIVDVLPSWARPRGSGPHEMVLGWKWIEAFGAVVDSARRTISVREWRTRDIL